MTEHEAQFYEDMGRQMRDRRRKVGLSQAAVASQLGVDRTTVLKWEAGRQVVAAHWVPEVAALLGMTVASLIGGPTRPIAASRVTPEVVRARGGA